MEPITLEGEFVRLEPLRGGHLEDLWAAAQEPDIWRWMPIAVRTRADLEILVEEAVAAQAAGRELPFAVVDRASGRAVGSTRYLDIDPVNRGLEIGWTWYGRAHRGGAVNPESKLLLIRHAFEEWGAIRVFLKTDSRNERSRAAILKLGARYEGDLRNHRIRPDGTYRDTSYYSILPDEWPAVRRGLEARIAVYQARRRSAPESRADR